MALVKMGTKIPKKLMNLCVLDILADASERRPMTQDAIRSRLESDYGIAVDRKTVHRNLKALVEGVEQIRSKQKSKMVNGVETAILTDFYLADDGEDLFEDVELQVLVYSIIFSKHLGLRFKRDLLRKLEDLSSSRIGDRIDCCILEDLESRPLQSELSYNLEELSMAIAEKKAVSFRYDQYEADNQGTLCSEARTVTASPLGIGMRDDDFYLVALVSGVANTSLDDMISHFRDILKAMGEGEIHVDVFRIDRMKDLAVLEEDRCELNVPKGLPLRGAHNDTFNVQEYLRENPSLKAGRAVDAEFYLYEDKRCTFSDVVDHFGERAVRESRKLDDPYGGKRLYFVSVHTNSGALLDYALRHSANIEVVSPEDLRLELLETYQTALARMEGTAASS